MRSILLMAVLLQPMSSDLYLSAPVTGVQRGETRLEVWWGTWEESGDINVSRKLLKRMNGRALPLEQVPGKKGYFPRLEPVSFSPDAPDLSDEPGVQNLFTELLGPCHKYLLKDSLA